MDTKINLQMYGHLQHMLASRPCCLVLLPSSQQSKKHFTIQKQLREDPLRKVLKQSHEFSVVDAPRKDFDQSLGMVSFWFFKQISQFWLTTFYFIRSATFRQIDLNCEHWWTIQQCNRICFSKCCNFGSSFRKVLCAERFFGFGLVSSRGKGYGLSMSLSHDYCPPDTSKAASINTWNHIQCLFNMFHQKVRSIMRDYEFFSDVKFPR